LKKKIAQLDMEISNESKDRKIGELERENKVRRKPLLLHFADAHGACFWFCALCRRS
jgi:hypothetical protein